MNHVFDGGPGIARTVRLSGSRIDRRRRGRAVARAGDVRADHEVLVEIDSLAMPDESIPPTRLLVFRIGVLSGDVSVRGQGVTDEDGVRLLGIELAERFVADRERRNRLPMREAETVVEKEIL